MIDEAFYIFPISSDSQGIVGVTDPETPVLIQAVYDTYDIEHVPQDLDVSTLVFIGRYSI